jgi:signal transduction histidine kinase
MNLADAQDIFWIQLFHLAALSLILWSISKLFFRTQKSVLLKRYLFLQTLLLIWIVCKMLKTVAPNVTIRWIFIVIQYIGVSFIGVSFFHFVFYLTFRQDPGKIILRILYFLSSLTLIFISTNPLHHLFYSTFDFYGDTFGPLLYWHAFLTYFMILAGIVILIMGMIRKKLISLQEQLLTAAALFPLFFNILYLTEFIKPVFDYTPIAISISLFFLALAAFRNHFLGVLPMAYNTIVTGLESTVIILDHRNQVLYGEKFLAAYIIDKSEDYVFTYKEREYRIVKIVHKKNKTLYHLSDISFLRSLQREQSITNEELNKLTSQIQLNNAKRLELVASETINHARRELHDLLGHSLTQIILLLQSAKLLSANTPSEAYNSIIQAEQVCKKCLDDTDNIEHYVSKPQTLLSESLHQLAESFSSMNFIIELAIQGSECSLDPGLISSLYRCCQEGITNAVKHGKAGKVDLVLQFKNDKLILIIADNGYGNTAYSPGQGLTMMNDRLLQWGAVLRHESSSGDGFLLSISCPLIYETYL